MGTLKKSFLPVLGLLLPLMSEGAATLSVSIPYAMTPGQAISSSGMTNNFEAITSFINADVCLRDGTNCQPINGSIITNLSANNISTGTLPISRGGTGTTSLPGNRALIFDGSGISGKTCSAGQILGHDGTGNLACLTVLPVQSGGTGVSSLGNKAIFTTDASGNVQPLNCSAGDIVYFNASGLPQCFAKCNAGEVLSFDTNGPACQSLPPVPVQIGFMASLPAGTYLVQASNPPADVNFPVYFSITYEVEGPATDFDPNTGVFSVPVTGFYQIFLDTPYTSYDVGTMNGPITCSSNVYINGIPHYMSNGTHTKKLQANDQVILKIGCSGMSTPDTGDGGEYSSDTFVWGIKKI